MTAPNLTEQLDAALANYTAGIDRAVRFVTIDQVDMLAEFYLQTRRADLAAVQPAQVKPDCCDICRGGTFAETSDGKGWRCVECKAVWLSHTLEPQPDPRDEVIARLVDALGFYADMTAWTQPPVKTREGLLTLEYENQASKMQKDRGAKARAALAAAKAVQHG